MTLLYLDQQVGRQVASKWLLDGQLIRTEAENIVKGSENVVFGFLSGITGHTKGSGHVRHCDGRLSKGVNPYLKLEDEAVSRQSVNIGVPGAASRISL